MGLFSCASLNFVAQDLNYPIVFNELSGLPLNAVYDCIQDKNGKIWITTSNGIISYDGYRFKWFNEGTGLPTSFSWKLKEDRYSRIWLTNNHTPLTYLKNDSIHRVGEHIDNFFLLSIFEDDNGNVYAVTGKQKYITIKIDKDDQTTIFNDILLGINKYGEKVWFSAFDFPATILIKMATNNEYTIFETFENNDHKITLIDLNTKKVFTNPNLGTNNRIVNIGVGQEGTIQVTNDFGVLILDTLLNIKDTLVKNEFEFEKVGSIYLDKNNNSWISDLKNGLIFYQRLAEGISYTRFEHPQSEVHSVYNGNGQLLAASQNGVRINLSTDSVFYSRGNKSELQPFNAALGVGKIHFDKGFHYVTDSNLTTKHYPIIDSLPRNSYPIRGPNIYVSMGGYKTHCLYNKELLIGTNAGCFITSVENDSLYLKRLLFGYVFAISKKGDDVFTGNDNGLFKTNLVTGITDTLIKNEGISHIKSFTGGVIVRKANGTLISYNNDLEPINSTNDFLSFDYINIIDDRLWAFNKDELIEISVQNFETIRDFDKEFGIVNPHKIAFEKYKGEYYLICKEGFYKFRQIDSLDTPLNQSFFDLQSISVNGAILEDCEKIELHDNKSFVEINLSAYAYPFSNEITYEYQIGDSKKRYTKDPRISFMDVPYGTYQITIRALKSDRQYGTTLVIDVENPLPFYLSIWFYFAVSVSFIFLISFYFYYYYRRKSRTSELKFQVIQNRQKMLMMQMKPHFLSNVFNNLQGALFSNDYETGNELIKNMDVYLRQMLKSSEKSMNLLHQEIVFVQKYVELENGRISKKIEVKMTSNVATFEKIIEVPVFVLQPLVENAIWHGILPSQENTGVISIDVQENANYYLISVSDNGVGLKGTTSSGNSIALKNIESRLSLIDPNKRMENHIELVELEKGTKATLFVPKIVQL